jgi:hypothetical protein
MSNDIPNATASFAIVMKALQESAKNRTAKAETARTVEKGDLDGKTAQVSDSSTPAGETANSFEEGDLESSNTKGT